MPTSEHVVSKLTSMQRAMLIDHIDGHLRVVAVELMNVRRTLLAAKLLRGHPQFSIRPRETALTEEGRRVVGMILGQYADALVRAGLLDQQNPIEMLRRLREARSAPSGAAPWKSALLKQNL